ncbi:MAG: membrane protein insertase YidC [Desulfobacteraceae bacterium]|nr:MAG: membrane protein insertase YidC [Desulfobacteraceae bacterium]
MEQARMLLAIALSFLVFFVWNYFFVEKPVETTVQTELQTNQIQPKTDSKAIHNQPQGITQQPLQELPKKLEDEPRMIVVDTPIYKVSLSEEQACFSSFVLKHYRESVEADSPLKELIQRENHFGTIFTHFLNNSVTGIQTAIYTASEPGQKIIVNDSPKTLSFSWESAGGIVVSKKYRFYPDQYVIDLEVSISNRGEAVLNDTLVLSLSSITSEKKQSYGFEGPGALINNKLETIDIDDIEETPGINGKIKWISIQDRYFISSLIPRLEKESKMEMAIDKNNFLTTSYHEPILSLGPGQEQINNYQIYMGPKSVSILQGLNVDLDMAVHFGFFDFIAKPCLWLMNFLFRYIPNYGVAIIILTVLIKILFWPLGTKSYKSMNEMKKLQPLMAEIREKYKDDKKRMNEEVMGLYKTYKINPLGGCLPMIAQIPVFFALYQMLYGAIELRHAPFIGWINDLSSPDRLFDFGFSVPFMEPPYGIPVLTIIMGATMLIQQKLQPPAGDPTQAKMMMMMPIVFTVIFINFSSGLVLYWLINNILSIAQQYFVSKTKV